MGTVSVSDKTRGRPSESLSSARCWPVRSRWFAVIGLDEEKRVSEPKKHHRKAKRPPGIMAEIFSRFSWNSV